MTDKTTAKAAPRRRKPEHADYLKKDPSEVHLGFSEYIGKTTGHEVPVGDVALVLRLYPVYLKSPAIVQAKEAAQAAREVEKAAKEKAKRDRLQQRLDRIEAERQKVLADLGIEPVVQAADRFATEPDPEPEVDADGDPIAEDDEWGDEPSGDDVTGPIKVEPGPGAALDDDDDWADEPEDEEEF